MPRPSVLIFHRRAQPHEPELVRLLSDVRAELAEHQRKLFEQVGLAQVRVVAAEAAGSFGQALADLAPARGGTIVLGGGAVPLLSATDAAQLRDVAGSSERRALTNNRYSSDICAVGVASVLRGLPPLPNDNALPRWLAEKAGFVVDELPARHRLALDLDSPLDVALVGLHARAPAWLRTTAHDAGLTLPRLGELRAVASDPRCELLVFGRSSADTLRWLERNVPCRVRFLAEERGLRASSPLAGGPPGTATAQRPPRATLGRLLDVQGPAALGTLIGELADGAVLDTRVLLADRLGPDEAAWPPAADRYASDLLRAGDVRDPWLRELTAAAAGASVPILLGAHSLVGPGLSVLLRASPS